ncbi:hypothetical protein BDB00DRAFT_763601 [Zychaea mexicana]|uniref:uncharacterized protein n=1 Tax=Zychaea mexicana TaxID=64656 RepID=UPI0022FE9AA1|nr:uncharacterized protein BDB00DRAFT_763601 [Zychaea mexicana]KAI9493441.1 hypothetical protein BDB00DRAFT_763601 [Zychaea mexicana]
MSSPPPNSTHSWYTLRSDETDAWIQQGIEYHEKGAIQQATLEFQRAANASSPIGLFLYGLSLRHGWGCKRSERTAFRYLQKSAEHAIFDLQKFVSGRGNKFIANRELVMAIYELGQAYCHGWGCHKDKKTAAYYFKIAADLGDADAQNEVARCYHHGQGFKKDMKLAAKYYRKADQQGHGMVGNSWIYKEKYGAPVQAGSSSS